MKNLLNDYENESFKDSKIKRYDVIIHMYDSDLDESSISFVEDFKTIWEAYEWVRDLMGFNYDKKSWRWAFDYRKLEKFNNIKNQIKFGDEVEIGYDGYESEERRFFIKEIY